jgi:limonene 1,2-monooxygenase
VNKIKDIVELSGGFGTVIGFVHDWANRENTNRSWDLVARYVVPAINGLLDDYKESNQYVIENRDTWNRAGQAIMSKIQENERAVAAMKEQAGPSQSALAPHSGEATKKAAKGKPS